MWKQCNFGFLLEKGYILGCNQTWKLLSLCRKEESCAYFVANMQCFHLVAKLLMLSRKADTEFGGQWVLDMFLGLKLVKCRIWRDKNKADSLHRSLCIKLNFWVECV